MNELESRLPFSVEPESVVLQLRLGVEKAGTVLALQTRGTAVVDVVDWVSFDGAGTEDVCRFAGLVDTVVTWVVVNNRTAKKSSLVLRATPCQAASRFIVISFKQKDGKLLSRK